MLTKILQHNNWTWNKHGYVRRKIKSEMPDDNYHIIN